MAKQKQDDQPELTYSSYVRTQDVTQKTCRRRWTIGKSGERWSRISVLAARLDDDDDDDDNNSNNQWWETIFSVFCKFVSWNFNCLFTGTTGKGRSYIWYSSFFVLVGGGYIVILVLKRWVFALRQSDTKPINATYLLQMKSGRNRLKMTGLKK